MSKITHIKTALALAAAAKRARVNGSAHSVRQEALRMIEAEELAAPVFCYRNVEVREVHGDVLELRDVKLCAPGLVQISSRLTAVTAVVCTLGPALETRVSELCSMRNISLALALDELGNGMLMYAARFAELTIRKESRDLGLSAGNALFPGGSGMSLDQQEVVVQVARGDHLGIHATEQGMLSPVKSRSMVIGIGKGLSSQPLRKRCETCSSRGACQYRTR